MEMLPYTSFGFRKDLGILFFRWLNPIQTEEFKTGYLQALEAGEKENLYCWLFDTRRRGAATFEAEDWYFSVYIPLLKTRLKTKHCIAVLHTPAHFVHIRDAIGFDKFKAHTKGSLLTMEFFDSEHSAVEWLKGCQN